MSKDKEFFSSNKSDNLTNDGWLENPSKNILEKMEEERIQRTRKDVIIYKLKIQKVLQATTIIVFIVLFFDSLVYLSLGSLGSLGANWGLSWLMLIQAGFLLLISGVTISKTSKVEKRRKIPQSFSSDSRNNLKFAFFHSLTWFISGVTIAILSYVVFYAIP